ncbi:cytidylyltransferase, putative [Bodo saltans]|uniref:Cytidylyltransferase, putative n=1 Tax=Bodo saltans TaxID=75058 RepID=A0A0S4J9K4_BODSA|nr:cytidylyltransferase, putative [Bodo saltans]|eukprot:CUG87041.1 cytidylyltransferase, putative [Bodo saltans]
MSRITFSLLRGVEENVAGLLAHLQSRNSSPTGEQAIDVLLTCPSTAFNRSLFITHMQQLYNASTSFDCQTIVNIVPRVEGTSSSSSDSYRPLTKRDMTFAAGFDPVYNYVAVGGTFDRLHSGHKLLLTVSALHTFDKLRVGITGPELLTKKKFAEKLESFETRKRNVETFLRLLRSDDDLELELEPIEEFSGGTDRIAGVEALCASPETLPAIPKINALRRERQLNDIVAIPIYFVGGDTPSVSSSRLRELESQRDQEKSTAN